MWRRWLNEFRGWLGVRVVTVLAYGDSNTARPSGTQRRWTDYLQGLGGGRLRVVNAGYSGRTVGFDAGQRNGLAALDAALEQAPEADWIVVMLGTNDLKRSYGPAAVEAVVENMNMLLDSVARQRPRARVILASPPPLAATAAGEFAFAGARLEQLVEALRVLARRRALGFVDLYAGLRTQDHLQADGVHLNKRGRREVARLVWELLRPAYGHQG